MESREPATKPARVAKRMGTILGYHTGSALEDDPKVGAWVLPQPHFAARYFHLAKYPAKLTGLQRRARELVHDRRSGTEILV